jgi:Leucine Rich Repeat (LRR) protein
MSWTLSHVGGFVATLPLLACGNLRADDAEDKAAKAVEKLGGYALRDNKMKGKPVWAAMLSFTKATDADLKVIKDFPHLRAIHLQNTKVTDAGLQEVKTHTDLEELNLVATAVTDSGLKELADLKKLQKVYVTGSKVTAAGAAELQKALPNCKVFR